MDWYYVTYGLVLRYVWIGITLRMDWYYITYGLVLRYVWIGITFCYGGYKQSELFTLCCV